MLKKSNILSNVIDKKNIVIYILTFMVSTISITGEVSPFSIAMCGASIASEVPIIGVIIAGLIGNIVGLGTVGALNYILITLILLITIFIRPPIMNEEEKNEKVKLSRKIFFTIACVMIVKLIITKLTIAELISHITLAVITTIFYKIFVNSISVVQQIHEKRAFSIEEVIGASMFLCIAVCSFRDFNILGFSIRNILSILIILVLGWKNGILVGATAGITIGATLGIIVDTNPIMITIYALSGLISGLLNRFGKIGVIAGFVAGNGILLYIAKGDFTDYIIWQEILIASLGLLALPKWVGVNVQELFKDDSKYLPIFQNRGLNESKTIEKLNVVSETLKDISQIYKQEPINKANKQDKFERNRNIFISELLNFLDGKQDNMLYEDLVKPDNKIVKDLYNILLEKEEITRQDLLKTFAKFNNYIIELDDENVSKYLNNSIEQAVKAINDSYKISKTEFVLEEKEKTNKKKVQAQLEGVSKAITTIATTLVQDKEDVTKYIKEKEQIISMLETKDIDVQNIEIRKQENNRTFVDIYLKQDSKLNENDDIEKIQNVIEKVLKEKVMLNEPLTKKQNKLGKRVFCYMSSDKYIMQIGRAIGIKNNNSVSGDSMIQIRLSDGKYLLAISDGMGSGAEARKSSQIAVKMLERLFMSGFDKQTAIGLINSSLMNVDEEIFATIDIAIVDLYNGTVEFIKNGACPTYIKNNKKVQLVKSLSLPAGILEEINLTTYDKDIENNDIIVMISDGILDSNIEFKNKELWVKYLLEDIESDNCQKIADIVLNEAIDNNYGILKDDMSIFTCKFIVKE